MQLYTYVYMNYHSTGREQGITRSLLLIFDLDLRIGWGGGGRKAGESRSITEFILLCERCTPILASFVPLPCIYPGNDNEIVGAA